MCDGTLERFAEFLQRETPASTQLKSMLRPSHDSPAPPVPNIVGAER